MLLQHLTKEREVSTEWEQHIALLESQEERQGSHKQQQN